MRRDQLNRRVHRTSAAAKAERHQSPQILQRARAVRHSGGGGSEVRRAFVKTTPTGATVTVDVYLDVDTIGDEVNVTCYIYGDGYLLDAYPTLVDGMPLYVQYDLATSTWRNVTEIAAINEDCGA